VPVWVLDQISASLSPSGPRDVGNTYSLDFNGRGQKRGVLTWRGELQATRAAITTVIVSFPANIKSDSTVQSSIQKPACTKETTLAFPPPFFLSSPCRSQWPQWALQTPGLHIRTIEVIDRGTVAVPGHPR